MPKKSPSCDTIYVALLRAVNVGGKNIISMNALKKSFEAMGFQQVSSYINSGNILFRAAEADHRELEREIEAMLSREYRLDCKVVVRSFAEMARLVTALPEDWNSDTGWKYNVIFLRHSIDSEKILEGLQPQPEIEEVVYVPGTLLWSALVSEVQRTAMNKLSSKKIFQDMTVRNLNTTRKVYELMQKISETCAADNQR